MFNMKRTISKKIMGRYFLFGMASVFFPSIASVEPLPMPNENDTQSIADDWKAVGSYIKSAMAYADTTK